MDKVIEVISYISVFFTIAYIYKSVLENSHCGCPIIDDEKKYMDSEQDEGLSHNRVNRWRNK